MPNNRPDFVKLSNFIAKRSDLCTAEELKEGIDAVGLILNKNPVDLITILSNDPYIPASYLFSDLVEKMKLISEDCQPELLFKKIFEQLIAACVYTIYDLKRFLNVFTKENELDKVMTTIISDDNVINRFFENNDDPLDTLQILANDYPQYEEPFVAYYSKINNSLVP